MKSLHRSASKGFTLIELLVVIAIIAILAALAVPQIAAALTKGQLTQTLNNARQIHIATLRMTTDASVTPDPKLGWPGDVTDISTLSGFVERLVEYKYIDRGDIKSLFYAPGVKAYRGTGPFDKENSAFDIYPVKDTDVSQVIYIATRNYEFGVPLKPTQSPYGNKGAVLFRKGGEGVIINDQQATHSSDGGLGFNPGGTSMEDVGPKGTPLS
jgi:prepilin-type N-terminal cleavage/methylation domain-containing protein